MYHDGLSIVSAADAIRILESRGTLTDVKVNGALRLAGQHITRRLAFDNVVFSGEFNISDCTFDGRVRFNDCVFQRRFDAASAQFESDLELQNCMVLSEAFDDFVPPNSPFNLTSATVAGDLRLIDLTMRGKCSLGHITVEGGTSIAGLELDHAQSVPGLKADPGSFEPLPIFGGMELRNAKLRGGLTIRPIGRDDKRRTPRIAADLNLREATIDGLVVLEELETRGSLTLIGTKLAGLTIIDRCRIKADLDLSVDTTSQVQLKGTMVGGVVSVIAARFGGGLRFEATQRSGEPNEPCRIGRLLIGGAVIKSAGLGLPGLKILGGMDDAPSLSIKMSEIEGGLKLTQEKRGTYPRIASATVMGRIELSQLRVRGDLDLRGIAASDVIDLSNSLIDGDLLLGEREPAPDASDQRAHARGILAPNLTVTKDCDLTGIDLDPTVGASGNLTAKQQSYAGAVHAPRMTVNGKLLLAPVDGEAGAHLNAPCGLALSHSKINHLVVSGRHMAAGPAAGAGSMRELDLAGAEITVLEAHTNGAGTSDRYPQPLRLTDATVATWRCDGQRMTGSEFDQMLKGLLPFSRKTYLQAESFLRTAGHDEEADAIYVAMKKAAHRQPREPMVGLLGGVDGWLRGGVEWFGAIAILPFIWLAVLLKLVFAPLGTVVRALLREPLHRSFDFLLKFGTNPLPLLFFIVLLYATTIAGVLSDPRNVQPTLEYRAATAGKISDQATPDAANWDGWRAAVLALRYHIPIAVIQAQDEWEARDAGPLHLPQPLCSLASVSSGFFGTTPEGRSDGCHTDLIAAQDWTTLMSILNYIMWPLLLTFFLRRLLRT